MRPLVVLQSFRNPRSTTNPYVVQLAERIDAMPEVSIRYWTWAGALLSRYDVLHVHWPEALWSTPSPLKGFLRQLLYGLVLVRLRITGKPLVRTVHNLELPQGLSRLELLLLRLTERWTTLRVAINETTPMPPDQAWALIPHGHYRDWFASLEPRRSIPGRITYVGLIRRYKAVDRLVRAFVQDQEELADCSLHIAGKPSSETLVEELRALADSDDRIDLHFDFLDDEQLVAEVSEAELVVLPYRVMHNSGATLTTLSLDRPVLVPDNSTNRALREEVGVDWLYCFVGELDAQTIARTLQVVRDRKNPGRPDLSRRDWADAGVRHLAAYREAVQLARRRPRFADRRG